MRSRVSVAADNSSSSVTLLCEEDVIDSITRVPHTPAELIQTLYLCRPGVLLPSYAAMFRPVSEVLGILLCLGPGVVTRLHLI